jgi:hypothetical protein
MQLVLEPLDHDLSMCEHGIEVLSMPHAVLDRLNLLTILVLLLLLELCYLLLLLLYLTLEVPLNLLELFLTFSMKLWMQDLVSSRDNALLLKFLLHNLVGGLLGHQELLLETLDLVRELVDLSVQGKLLVLHLLELRILVVLEPVMKLLNGGLCCLEDIWRGVGMPGLSHCLGKHTQGLSLLTLFADVDLLGVLSSLRLVLLVYDHGELHLHPVVLFL